MADENEIQTLKSEIIRLRDENKKLEETVQWMHDLIWEMVREREQKKGNASGEARAMSLSELHETR